MNTDEKRVLDGGEAEAATARKTYSTQKTRVTELEKELEASEQRNKELGAELNKLQQQRAGELKAFQEEVYLLRSIVKRIAGIQ